MRDKFKQKLIASALLTLFGLANTGIGAFAANEYLNYGYASENNSRMDVPVIRGGSSSDNIKLTGDVTFTEKKSPVTLSLRDSDVTQVLRMFADKAGYNIIFFSDDINDKVTMDLVNVPLNSAFSMIMEKAKLTFAIKDNTLIIAKAGDNSFKMSQQEITLLPVKYVSASAIAEFLNKNVYSMAQIGSAGKDIAVTNPSTNEIMIFGSQQDVNIARKIIAEFDRKPTYSTFKVNHTTPEQMANMICDMLIPSIGGSSSGGSTGGAAGIMTGGAAGVVTGFADSLELGGGEVACTLSSDMSAGDYSSIGIQNLSIAYFAQLGTISILGGSESQVDMIKEFVSQMDKKQPQAYLEVGIIELSEDGSKSLANSWTFNSDFLNFSFGDGSLSTQPAFPIMINKSTIDVFNENGEVDHTIKRYVRGKSLMWTINYILENNKGRTVANPKILITNGQESTIDLTSDYIETTDVEYQTAGTGTFTAKTYNIGSDNGVKVTITPFISPDGYVTLNIQPEYSTIRSQLTQVDEFQQEYIAATMLQRRNLDLKNVRIKDGETLVIGGMISEREAKTVKKFPGLGDLPVIGAAFRSTSTTKSKEEMIIMITPKIITDTEDAVSAKNAL